LAVNCCRLIVLECCILIKKEKEKVKVNQCRYRPGVAQRVPGS
jgi:hypothetical protein